MVAIPRISAVRVPRFGVPGMFVEIEAVIVNAGTAGEINAFLRDTTGDFDLVVDSDRTFYNAGERKTIKFQMTLTNNVFPGIIPILDVPLHILYVTANAQNVIDRPVRTNNFNILPAFITVEGQRLAFPEGTLEAIEFGVIQIPFLPPPTEESLQALIDFGNRELAEFDANVVDVALVADKKVVMFMGTTKPAQFLQAGTASVVIKVLKLAWPFILAGIAILGLITVWVVSDIVKKAFETEQERLDLCRDIVNNPTLSVEDKTRLLEACKEKEDDTLGDIKTTALIIVGGGVAISAIGLLLKVLPKQR